MATAAYGSMEADAYVNERITQYASWYDKKAVRSKSLYFRMRTVSVVGAAVVPVLVNLDFAHVKTLATLLSLIVVLSVSLESVFHFGDQWKNYRSSEQFLNRELFLFRTREGTYREIPDERAAFVLLVERIENAIATENAATLNTLAVSSQSESKTPR